MIPERPAEPQENSEGEQGRPDLVPGSEEWEEISSCSGEKSSEGREDGHGGGDATDPESEDDVMDIRDETGVRWHMTSSEEEEEGEEKKNILEDLVQQLTIEKEEQEEAQRNKEHDTMEGCYDEEILGYYQKQRREKAMDREKLNREARLWDRRFPGKPTREAWKIMGRNRA